jgi:hypothetical protein
MPERRRGYALIAGALILSAIALGITRWHSTRAISRFAPANRFTRGASAPRAPQPAKAGGQRADAAATTDIAARNGTLAEKTSRITTALKGPGGLTSVLEHDLRRTRPQIAAMIGRRDAGADLLSGGALAAAVDAWCFTGPHATDAIRANDSILSGNLFGVPENAIEPGGDLVLLGCGFGTAPGSVRMSLDSSGQSFDLPVEVDRTGTPWDKFAIWVRIPVITGVTDQMATVSVTDSGGRVSALPVPLVATRESQIFSPFAHVDRISINPECLTATTDDSCGGAPVGDARFPDGRTFVGVHWKLCCRGVDGTDTYSIKLNNGWTAEELAPFVNNPVNPSGSSVTNFDQGGLTTCWWFGNSPGWARYWGAFPSTSPDFTIQVQFIWHVDGNCSAAHYNGNLVIVGPKGVPF